MTTTFGAIGSGRRTRFFLRVAAAMPDALREATGHGIRSSPTTVPTPPGRAGGDAGRDRRPGRSHQLPTTARPCCPDRAPSSARRGTGCAARSAQTGPSRCRTPRLEAARRHPPLPGPTNTATAPGSSTSRPSPNRRRSPRPRSPRSGCGAARCSGLRVLATSREPLAVDGEALVPLAPLALYRVHAALACRPPDGQTTSGSGQAAMGVGCRSSISCS